MVAWWLFATNMNTQVTVTFNTQCLGTTLGDDNTCMGVHVVQKYKGQGSKY